MPRRPSDLPSSPLPDREREICLRFRQIRIDAGMKQEPFARRLGIPVTRLKSYELGRAPIRYELAARVGVAFDINQQWLACEDAPKRPHFFVADELEWHIPGRWLFSEIYEKLLRDLIGKELERMAEVRGITTSEIREIAWQLDQVGLGASESSHKSYLSTHFQSWVAQQLTRFPLRLYGKFGSDLQRFLESFERHHKEEVNAFLDLAKSHPLAELQIEKNRGFVAQKLGVPAESLPKHYGKKAPSPQHFHFTKADMRAEKRLLTYTADVDTQSGRYEHTTPVNMQKNHIPTRIKKARKQLGLSQREAAEKWGFPVQTIQQWEHGRREPRALYAEKIEAILSEIESAPKRKP